MKKISSILLSAWILSACSGHFSNNGDNFYLHSHNGANIQVPSPLTCANISTFYNLPEPSQRAPISVIPPLG